MGGAASLSKSLLPALSSTQMHHQRALGKCVVRNGILMSPTAPGASGVVPDAHAGAEARVVVRAPLASEGPLVDQEAVVNGALIPCPTAPGSPVGKTQPATLQLRLVNSRIRA